MPAALGVREEYHRPNSRVLRPEEPQLLEQVSTRGNDPRLADLIVLCPPTNSRLVEVHVIPTQRQNCAQTAASAPSQQDEWMQKWVNRRCHREQPADGCRIQERAFGVFLRWNADLLEHMSGEERATSLVLLAGPVQRRFEHPEISLNGIRSDRPSRHTPAAAPHDILVNPIRRQLADHLIVPEELA